MDDPEARSSRIAWSWVIEALATHGEVGLQLLWDLIQSIPQLSDNLNEDPREVIAFRNLESLFDPAMVSKSGIPSSSDQEDIQFDSSESFSHVLKCVMDQPSMPSLRKDGENPLPIVRKCSSDKLLREVDAYIKEKKASMPIGALQELSDILQRVDACHETDLEREMSCLKTQELMQNSTVEAQNDKSPPKRKLICEDTGSIASAEQTTSPLISSHMQDCPIGDQSDKLPPRKKRRHNSSGSKPCTKLKLAPSTSHDMQDSAVDDQTDKLLSVKKCRDNDNTGSVPCTDLKLAPSISVFPADGQTGKIQSQDNSGFIASTEKNSDNSVSYDHPVSQLEQRTNAEKSSMPDDVTEPDICIKCYERGDMLICRGSSCPVVVHQRCLGITESIENRDNFLCPFCVCSLAKSKYDEAKERLLVARHKLTLFIGGITDNQPKKNTKVNSSSETSNNCQDRQFTNVNPSSSRKSRLSEAAQAPTDNQNEVRLAQENIIHTSPSKSIPENTCQTENRFVLVNSADEKSNGVDQASTDEQHNGNSSPNCSLKEGEELEKRDKIIPIEKFDYTGGSSGVRTRSKNRTAKISDNFSSPKSQRKLTDLHGASTGSIDEFDLVAEGETSGANVSRSPQRFKKVGRRSYRPNRVPWTDEEVEMLKEGVKRYGSGDVGNMPWSVILEFGSSVFWKGRTGVSLKDKWRNLLKANPGLR